MNTNLITPEEAEALIQHHVPRWGTVECPLPDATGGILRKSIVADRDLPPYDRITMDGIAIAYTAWQANMRRFQIENTVAAGHPAPPLQAPANGALRVMTGAMLPPGADAIVPVEECTFEQDEVTVRDDAQVAPLQYLHSQGSDRRQGDTVLEAGLRLGAPHISIAAAVGQTTLTISKQPPVAILSTGDELKAVHEPVEPYQIRSANDAGLRAALRARGFPHVDTFHVHDDAQQTRDLLQHLLATYKVILVTGGVSMGAHDHVPDALHALDVEKHFHKIRQKPGKPMWFGTHPTGVPVFALPGNTVSALVCLHRYVLPALDIAQGATPRPVPWVTLETPLRFSWPLTGFVPVRLSWKPTGECRAHPQTTNTSGDFSALHASDGFVELPAGKDLFVAGEALRYYPWQ